MPGNLVLCAFGDSANIGAWCDRSVEFDTALCYFGTKAQTEYEHDATFFLRNRDAKLPNFIRLFDAFPEIFRYEYFFFLDDDLILTSRDIGAVFQTARRNRLDLSAPSFSHESSVSWRHLLHKPGRSIEYTSFIEISCFCMSRRFLRRVFPFFFVGRHGSGVDIAFHHVLRREPWTAAIIHDVLVHHPARPQAETVRADLQAFVKSGEEVLRRVDFVFGLPLGTGLGGVRTQVVRWDTPTRLVTRLVELIGRLLQGGQ